MKDWKIVTWKEVLEIKNGKNQKKVQNEAGIYPIYGSGGVMGYSNDFLCPEGTTIIGRKGSINNPIYVNEKFWNVDTAFGLIPSQKLDNKYLYYFCTTYNFLKHNKATTLPSLTKLDLLKIQIPLPPLDEQKRIAAILDAADLHRQKTKELIAKYDELAQALFLDMFGDPVTNPKGWEKVELQNCIKFINGDRSKNYPSGDDLKENGILFLSSREIVDFKLSLKNSNFITFEKFNNLSQGKVVKNDILLVLRGNGLGKCCVYDSNEYETAFINAQMVILRTNQRIILPHFVIAQIKTKSLFKELKSLGASSAQPQLSVQNAKRLKIIKPELNLQEKFCEQIEIIESQKSQAEQSLQKAEELFQSLLQKAFKGEL